VTREAQQQTMELVDDLATLSKLDEQILVSQLGQRYDAEKIYVCGRGFAGFVLLNCDVI
jgi:myosin heavy subunit